MTDTITIDDFKKVEIRVGEIVRAERIEGSEKLLKLQVNFGGATAGASAGTIDSRQVLSGIAAYVPDPQTLVGVRCAFVTNLAPRTMMGLESQAMLLASGGGEEALHLFISTAEPGSTAH